MRWKSHVLIKKMQSLFHGPLSSSGNGRLALENIRQAMLEALGNEAQNSHPVVQLRITYANEIQDLWYLRGDVMAALAALQGEAAARAKLAPISEMFRGLLPNGISTRPSPLSN